MKPHAYDEEGTSWFLTPRERNLLLTLFLVLSTHANELG